MQPSVSADVDVVPVRPVPAGNLHQSLTHLEQRCVVGDDAGVRALFAEAAWELLVQTVGAASPAAVDRIVHITRPHRDRLSVEHRRMDDVFRRFACPPASPQAARVGAAEQMVVLR